VELQKGISKASSFLRKAQNHCKVMDELKTKLKDHYEEIPLSSMILTSTMFKSLGEFQIKLHWLMNCILIFIDLIYDEFLEDRDMMEILFSDFMITYSYLETITSQLDQVLKLHKPNLKTIPAYESQIVHVYSSKSVQGLIKQARYQILRAVKFRNQLANVLNQKRTERIILVVP
jgi:hypothetical protein